LNLREWKLLEVIVALIRSQATDDNVLQQWNNGSLLRSNGNRAGDKHRSPAVTPVMCLCLCCCFSISFVLLGVLKADIILKSNNQQKGP
jgi:hypothetical protein